MVAVSAWVVYLLALISAYICCRGAWRRHGRTVGWLLFLVVWTTLVILPVQIQGALEILGLTHDVSMPKAAIIQFAILAGVVVFHLRFRQAASSGNLSDSEVHDRLPLYLALAAAVVAGTYLLFALDLGTSFPKGVDALSYHLPLALRWLQQRSLQIPANSAWQFTLPGNCEIVAMLALATGRQALAALGSWVASTVLAIAAYLLALKFSNGAKGPALAATLVVFTIPVIEFQTFSVYADLFGTAFLFAAIALFAHRYHSPGISETMRVERFSYAALFGSALACGLSLGAKTTFVPYSILFVASVVYILSKERSLHQKPVSMLLTLFLIGMLLPTAFWYVRAQHATGNPLYPIGVSIGNHVVLRGYQPETRHVVDEPPGGASNHGDMKSVRRPAEWFIYPWTEWLNSFGAFPAAYGEASGLGGAFAAFVTVGMAFLAVRCARRLVSGRVLGITGILLFAWLVSLLVWIFAMHRVLRFGLPIWVLACLLSAPAIRLLMETYPRSGAVLFVCVIAATSAVSSLVPLHDLLGNLSSGRRSRPAIYHYPNFIDELPSGACLLNDSSVREMDFVLAGSRLSNRVVTAFEAPEVITPDFISSRKIDYIVQVTTEPGAASSPPAALDVTEVFQSSQLGNLWKIWKVKNP